MNADIKFYRTPMREAILLTMIRNNPQLIAIVKNKIDKTKEFEEDLYMRMHGGLENFYTLFIAGEQGSRKSSTGQSIAKKFDHTFNADRICFTYDEFNNKFSESKPKESYLLDEEVFKHGTGSQRILNNMQTLIETLRKRQNSMIVISPEIKYFPEHLFTYSLETFDDALLVTCPINSKPHEARTCECYMKGKFQVTESWVRLLIKKGGNYIGFYQIKLDWNSPMWKIYSKRKDEFNESVVAQKHSINDYEGMADKMLSKPEIEHYKTRKQLKLFLQKELPTITVQEGDLVIEQIVMKRKMREEAEWLEKLTD